MVLDSDTVSAFLALLALASGITLFVVGRQSNATATALLWGFCNIFMALAVVLILERRAESVAFLCAIVATALMWTSIVAFNRRPLPSVWLIAGGLIWAFVALGPPTAWTLGQRGAIYLGICAVYLYFCAYELWRGRSERLPARWPLLALVLLDAVGITFTAIAIIPVTYMGEGSGSFWPVYVTTTIFIIGSAVFLLSMVKERAIADQHKIAQTDTLTGLANRGALMTSGIGILARARNRRQPVAVALFDLDSFKAINDTFGHRTGDTVLRHFAATAIAGLRPSDMIGRIGGEEFLAIIPATDEAAAIAIADRVRRSFAEAVEWIDGNAVKATVSAGVAVSYPGADDETLDQLVDRADRALYAAKAAGRNRISAATGKQDHPGATNIVRLA